MPGFVDPHNRTVLSAIIFELLTDVGYTKFPTRGQLLERTARHGRPHATGPMDFVPISTIFFRGVTFAG